ncbi:peptidoglycan-binding domain-containing protein [Roseibium algae]|uniref:Peptidoglycan-binding domain-containing protein n=1 Tax=Roseibium algae TaxID=3123038 RepID=A0ABU8TE70_9HYPH
MITRIIFMTLSLILGALPAAAQTDRIVALVITVGDGQTRADAIQAQLQLIGAETLRSDAPNNAELRSILTRFAREAANSRATFVYLDVPVVDFQGRSFVLPEGAVLDRSTDLFTQAIPIQAFSRSAAQAAQGGATVTTVVTPSQALPEGITVTQKAPDPIPTATPVLIATTKAFPNILAAFETALLKKEVEVSALLRRMTVHEGVTISDFPKRPIYLRETPQEEKKAEAAPEAVVIPELQPEPAPQPEADVSAVPDTPEIAAKEPSETLEELTLLEQSLSRAAKRSIQRKLRDLEFYKGLVDGIFGPQTRSAIKAFQSSRADNQSGVLTRRQLLDLST